VARCSISGVKHTIFGPWAVGPLLCSVTIRSAR